MADDTNTGNASQGQPTPGTSGGDVTPAQEERTFTQAQVNTYLAREMKKAEKKFEQRLSEFGMTPEDAEEFRKFKEDQAQAEKRRLEEKGKYEEAMKRQESVWQKERQDLKSKSDEWYQKYTDTVIDNALIAAAVKCNAVDTNLVLDATKKFIKMKDDHVTLEVVDSKGHTAFSKEGKEYQSIDEFMEEFLDKRPYLVRASSSQGSGTGAGGSTSGKGSLQERLIAASKSNNKAEYERLRKEIIDQGITFE